MIMTPWGQVLTAQDSTYTPQEMAQMRQNAMLARRAAGLGQGGIASVASAVGGALVRGVRIRTQVLPDMDLDLGGPPPSGWSPGEFLLKTVVKPEVVVDTVGGEVVYAPYGRPLPLWPLFLGGAAVGSYYALKWMLKGMRA